MRWEIAERCVCRHIGSSVPAWFVYVVQCRDGSLYTGIARDVHARVDKHNQGQGARYTRGRGPVRLVHVERKRSQGAALRREAAIKSMPRKAKVALVETDAP
jgi:putative endonuclease